VISAEPPCRASLRLTVGGAALLVAFGHLDTVARPTTADGVRRVAIQRIPAAAIDTLGPAALSEDGRLIGFVAGTSDSSRRCCRQVLVLDTSTGRTTRESVGADGTPADGDSQAPSLSADGQIIAFESTASNLIPGHTWVGRQRVIVRHRRDGVMRSPRGVRGQEPDGETREPVVSGNGGVVAFASDAGNLVQAPDANGAQTDVYLWRLDDSSITRVSVDTTGVQPPTGASHSPSLSRDGDRVAFVSTARLAPEDTNDVADVYLRDVTRRLTLLVSRRADGRALDGPSYSPASSADGRYVAFVSRATNLVPRDRNQESDVYLYDVAAGAVTLVSAAANGSAANAGSSRPRISGDGQYVVYQSLASNLGSGPGCPSQASDTNLLPDVYLFDRTTRCVTRVSGSSGREWWTPSVAPAIDGAGTLVVFSSTQPVGDDDVSTDFDLFLFLGPTRHSQAAGWP
jgi:Tol biopolymer transport system component